MSSAHAADTPAPEDMLYMELETGRVTIQMFPDLAPKHVERIKKLVSEDFYDGLTFHRVIDGFMAQTGDPDGDGTGGSEYGTIPAEFNNYRYRRGTVGMARTSRPDSANSQFFICFNDEGCSFLTGQYTVWGQVISGMEHVDKLARGEPPANPDKIISMEVAANVDNQVAENKNESKQAAE